MIRLNALLLVAVLIMGGCAQSEPEIERLDQVILLDVQGLWGGQDLWISANGKAACRFVAPTTETQSGLQETRYSFVLSAQQQADLLELVKKHRFFSIKTKDRHGVPDEARPSIVISSGPNTHAVGKWANDEHKDFDPIYRLLLSIVESGKREPETHRGAFIWEWKPDGFPESKGIWNMTTPNMKIE
jgi:hypothetical protein